MTEATNESQVVSRIVKAVREAYPGCWDAKIHGNGYQRSGIPDLLFCVEGRFVGIEVKHQKPGESEEHMLGRVTMIQKRELRNIKKAGGVAGVAWTVEQALDIVASALS